MDPQHRAAHRRGEAGDGGNRRRVECMLVCKDRSVCRPSSPRTPRCSWRSARCAAGAVAGGRRFLRCWQGRACAPTGRAAARSRYSARRSRRRSSSWGGAAEGVGALRAHSSTWRHSARRSRSSSSSGGGGAGGEGKPFRRIPVFCTFFASCARAQQVAVGGWLSLRRFQFKFMIIILEIFG